VKQTQLKVEFFDEVIDPEYASKKARIDFMRIYGGYRTCYSPNTDVASIVGVRGMNPSDLSDEAFDEVFVEMQKLVRTCLKSGHQSPVEHASLTFLVSGCSRVLTHQLVRHRIASYSQQSQRYVDGENFDYIIPPTIEAIPEAKERFEKFMAEAISTYADLKTILVEHKIEPKQASDDARFVLPNATSSVIMVTMNIRSLYNLFHFRCCNRAMWETRNMANQILEICKRYYPVLFDEAGPRCIGQKSCPEGKFMCNERPFMKNHETDEFPFSDAVIIEASSK